jgi:murein DD-endopeptidase MepM/ murein hydrolase activator NlpD
VSPERFTGYHTGVDFEILPGEENIDVPISAICTGPLLIKRWANGYGGMVVQKCQLENQDITVVYGHLKITSVVINVNDTITAGEKIGILGKGYSTETDGERKHLHLGVHKGASPNTSGYIASSADLVNWIDITQYLK